MRVAFFGATQTVTGSRYHLTCGERHVLVDCGLFQGFKHLRLKNWAPLLFEPADLDAVVLTHAHLDHSGYLPLLVKRGFRGPIYCTPATARLCAILLPDSGSLQEDQAAFANRHGFSKHRPALPLYTQADARSCLKQLEVVDFGAAFAAAAGVQAEFTRAGHLLGAGSVRLVHDGTSILFSGDVGRPDDALMLPPQAPPTSDYLVIESTYGDRGHPQVNAAAELTAAIRRTCERGGVVIIPTFAVGRAQLLLHLLATAKAEGAIADLPVYLDSPMAIDATELLLGFASEHRLTVEQARRLGAVARLVRSSDESKALDRQHRPAVILAASGMATGGRVLHHLKHFAPDARNMILLAGFQAGGTRGAALAGGATRLRIHGEEIPVRAEVAQLSSVSAHADANQLIQWARQMPTAPRQVFVTHGEPAAGDALRHAFATRCGWKAVTPEYRDEFDLA